MKLKQFFSWLKKEAPRLGRNLFSSLLSYFAFFVLVIFFLLKKTGEKIEKTPLDKAALPLKRIWGKTGKNLFDRFEEKIDQSFGVSQMKRSFVISLAFENIAVKKGRTLITIGGMAVGIGAIVFLVSLGYGLEKLVISKVTRLEELRMADVSPGESTSLRLNNEAAQKIAKIENAEDVLPLVSVVGRVSFRQAVADVLVYAVPKKYFDYSSIEPLKGEIYQSNEVVLEKKVAGAKVELRQAVLGEKISEDTVYFNINPQTAVLVWSKSSLSGKVLGYTIRMEGGFRGEEYWGDAYYSDDGKGREAFDEEKNIFLGRWLKAKLPLYEKTAEEKLIPSLDEFGRPVWVEGWLMEKNLHFVDRYQIGGEILGEQDIATPSSQATFATMAAATGSAEIEWVELQTATESAERKEEFIRFEDPPTGNAVVSTGLMRLLNLATPAEAVGKEFKISFVIVKNLMPEIEGKIFSEEVVYRIVGVVEDDLSPYLYVPLVDLLKVGVSNFSQLRVVTVNKNALPGVRREIEVMGFRTSSTVDTVVQIEQLFANLRLLLGLLGMVALSVAVLGMFNTLTVSLLERTREIGGMKAIGMLSSEVRDLLLAEAMIMGFSGGLLGLAAGFLGGKTFSFVISLFSLAKGQGYLDLTFIPWFFTAFILIASFAVGVLTGLYPARRATKISALNALRYE